MSDPTFPTPEEAGWTRPATIGRDRFQVGDLVALDGRPGDWELMAYTPKPGRWQVEPAQSGERDRDEVHMSELRRLADAPQVRRGDLVLQNYPEQQWAGEVGAVYRLGRWVAETTRQTPGGRSWVSLEDVERLVVVTREQMKAAMCGGPGGRPPWSHRPGRSEPSRGQVPREVRV